VPSIVGRHDAVTPAWVVAVEGACSAAQSILPGRRTRRYRVAPRKRARVFRRIGKLTLQYKSCRPKSLRSDVLVMATYRRTRLVSIS
jgi:hypothetical protein